MYSTSGQPLSVTPNTAVANAEIVAEMNPLRYRGYYYDTETGFYYLQSRYYDPNLGRFINADSYSSTGQGILGNNMYAHCNNNPACCSDPTGELTDGQIHDSVLATIILDYRSRGYYYLSMTDTMIYYNGKDRWSGWGYCDLYDLQTGEVWELKKDSKSYSCTTQAAKRQLGRYVNGRLASNPNLPLSRGGDLVFEKTTYTIGDSNGTYTITYWQECQGILRYSYTFQKDYAKSQEAIQNARLACIVAATPIVVAGFCMVGGPAGAVASIPFVASTIAMVA